MRRGFTLLELIISVSLIFLLVLFLTGNYGTLKKAIDQAARIESEERDRDALTDLLTKDILQAHEIAIVRGKEYDLLQVGNTPNSLYARTRAYITYAVLKPSNRLIRIESSAKIALPFSSSALAYQSDFLVIDQPLRSFKIYKSEKSEELKGCALLLFLELAEGAAQETVLIELGLLHSAACS